MLVDVGSTTARRFGIWGCDVLLVEGLSKRFGSYHAVNNLSFAIKPGEILCLVGANGAGKTTTLHMLLNFIKPDSGRATIYGHDVTREANACRQFIMYLPEQVNLYNEFSATENLDYLARLANIQPGLQDIREALTLVGLAENIHDRRLRAYSKGMRQKVGIAFAILKNAKVLFLDEPTSGLDPSASMDFIKIIKLMKSRGVITLMVTHDLNCVQLLADQIGIMNHGTLQTLVANDNLSLSAIESLYFQYMDHAGAETGPSQ